MAAGRVLVLGADGFIGRHIVFALRAAGWEVIAQARRTGRLQAMGFRTLRADLTDPACHDPAFWRPHLPSGAALVNAAGLLTGSESAFAAVHRAAPRAALAALDGPAVLISAVGIDAAATPFARWRRATEALFAPHTILRPGLVLGETSYGGSSLLRAFAALPWRLPVVGQGDQPFNPIHAADLADLVVDCLLSPPGPGPWEIGGPETLSQAELALALRGWLGLAPVPVLRLPLPLARALGRVGEALRLGPVSATAVAQLQAGVLADPAPLLSRLSRRPRPVAAFLAARPAGTQDLWQARLYLVKPLIRLVLGALWIASAALGLLLSPGDFLPRSGTLLPETLSIALARLGGLADLALGLALLRDGRPRFIARAQIALVLAYTAGLTLLAPALWLDPFGALLKNLPILALMIVHLILVEER
ncbi:SDR family oxidoreductase [Neotabrizicola sp. sgz301269]|uniref:SDR family oxidoreductase n=1 Tax=Neotabrizicola sp. sgz301269 TaxID=3276282 RepID=UPI00376FC3F5